DCRKLLVLLFSSRRRHTRFSRDWSSDVCSSDLASKGRRFQCKRALTSKTSLKGSRSSGPSAVQHVANRRREPLYLVRAQLLMAGKLKHPARQRLRDRARAGLEAFPKVLAEPDDRHAGRL